MAKKTLYVGQECGHTQIIPCGDSEKPRRRIRARCPKCRNHPVVTFHPANHPVSGDYAD